MYIGNSYDVAAGVLLFHLGSFLAVLAGAGWSEGWFSRKRPDLVARLAFVEYFGF